jgi:hypothetical protein
MSTFQACGSSFQARIQCYYNSIPNLATLHVVIVRAVTEPQLELRGSTCDRTINVLGMIGTKRAETYTTSEIKPERKTSPIEAASKATVNDPSQ